MSDLPIIRIEIDSIRKQVSAMLSDRNSELNEYTQKVLSETLTEEWVTDSLKSAVKTAIRQAIEDVTNDSLLRDQLSSLLIFQISDCVKAALDSQAAGTADGGGKR